MIQPLVKEGEATPAAVVAPGAAVEEDTSEEAMLQRALAMSMDAAATPAAAAAEPDLGAMTEVKHVRRRFEFWHIDWHID